MEELAIERKQANQKHSYAIFELLSITVFLVSLFMYRLNHILMLILVHKKGKMYFSLL